MLVVLKNYDDPLLSIELKKHNAGNGAGGNLFYYQWVYNGVPFLELYGNGPTIVEYCSKIMEPLNAGFRLRRIRDHQDTPEFSMLTSDRLENYAAFIQAATRLSVPVVTMRLFCFIRADGGFNKALGVAVADNNGKVTHDTQQYFDDIDEIIVYIWENQAREMFGKQMNVNICINSCFMGLRFVAAQTPSFVADVKNATPQMMEYLDAPPLNVDNLVKALGEAITVGGISPTFCCARFHRAAILIIYQNL